MSIMAVLLYFAICSCVLFSIATGTTTLSADRAHSCPGAEVIFTCVVNTTVLSWDIDFLGSRDDINRAYFDTNDFIGRQLNVHTSQGTVYFYLTSKSPLTSTMIINASTDISGAIISCRDGHSSSAHVDTLVVEVMPDPQKVSNVTVVIPNIPIRYSAAADIINVTLEWDDESYPTNLERTNLHISSYTITVYPDTANPGSIFHTADTSIPLALNYDQDYNISVVASNCVGNSTPAEMRIRLVHCGPSVGKDIDVSSSTRGNHQANKLKTYCLYSSRSGLVPVFTPGEIGPDKSTLIDDCSKNGSTHQHSSYSSISEILVPALTASHFLLSSCTLIIGLLVGSLSHRCCRKKTKMSSMNEKVAEEPVYSEIPPKSVLSANHVSELVKSVDNVAYGQVSPP